MHIGKRHSSQKLGYVGFGSFHSDNVEDLIRLPDSKYQPPKNPIKHVLPSLNSSTPLGSPEIKALFHIDFDSWTFLNHGAFGASLIPASTYATQWRVFQERQPLRYFDRTLLPEMVNVYRKMASFINATPLDIVLPQNVTTALNTIVKSEGETWCEGDEVLTLNIGYGAVKSLLKTICASKKAVYREVQLSFPLSVESIKDAVLKQISSKTKFLLIDHMTSNTAIELPVSDIASACADKGIVVAVDGAHYLLNLHVDAQALGRNGVSYFVTNTHKWFCSPKGAAIMWVAPSVRERVRPLVLSHGSNNGLTSAFVWDGCHDYNSFLSLPVCLDVWSALGVERVRTYIHSLAGNAAHHLAKSWGTSILCPSLHRSMFLVELPASSIGSGPYNSTLAKHVQDTLYDNGVECPVKSIQDKLYVRISAHIYNNMNDFYSLEEKFRTIKFQEF